MRVGRIKRNFPAHKQQCVEHRYLCRESDASDRLSHSAITEKNLYLAALVTTPALSPESTALINSLSISVNFLAPLLLR
jgi:hypothetical protein